MILERTQGREKNINRPYIRTLTKDQTHNLSVRPNWESNLQTFGVGDNAPINSATQPGLTSGFDGSVLKLRVSSAFDPKWERIS